MDGQPHINLSAHDIGSPQDACRTHYDADFNDVLFKNLLQTANFRIAPSLMQPVAGPVPLEPFNDTVSVPPSETVGAADGEAETTLAELQQLLDLQPVPAASSSSWQLGTTPILDNYRSSLSLEAGWTPIGFSPSVSTVFSSMYPGDLLVDINDSYFVDWAAWSLPDRIPQFFSTPTLLLDQVSPNWSQTNIPLIRGSSFPSLVEAASVEDNFSATTVHSQPPNDLLEHSRVDNFFSNETSRVCTKESLTSTVEEVVRTEDSIDAPSQASRREAASSQITSNIEMVLGSATAVRGCEAITYPEQDDWERFKIVLRSMYIVNNMPVSDVRRYMAQRYGFHATANQYKKQFRGRWGWAKYAPTNNDDKTLHRRRKRKGVSCRRDPVLRRNALNEASTADGLYEIVLGDWKTFLEVELSQETKGQSVHWSVDQDKLIDPGSPYTFYHALRLLSDGQTTLGNVLLQHSLKRFLQTIHKVNVMDAFRTLLESVLDIIFRKQWHLLAPYLQFTKLLATKMRRSQNLSQIASTLMDLLRLSRGHIVQFIGEAHRVLHDAVHGGHTTQTADSLFLKRKQLEAYRCLGTPHVDQDWTVGQVVGDYSVLIERAEREGDLDAVLALQDASLGIQWCLDSFIEGFDTDCREYRDRLVERAGNPTSMTQWDSAILDRYVDSLVYLCSYCAQRDHHSLDEAMVPILEVAAWQSEQAQPLGMSSFATLPVELRAAGREDYADLLVGMIYHSRFLQSTAAVDQVCEGLSMFDGALGPDTMG